MRDVQHVDAIVAVEIDELRDRLIAGVDEQQARCIRLGHPASGERRVEAEAECVEREAAEDDVAQDIDDAAAVEPVAVRTRSPDDAADIGGAAPQPVVGAAQAEPLVETPFPAPDRVAGAAPAERRGVFLRVAIAEQPQVPPPQVARAVEWMQEGAVKRARVEREAILSAGAVQSPQVLQLSGIGPAGVLREHGIPVVADIPQVGENLQDHYQARTIVRLKKKISLNDDVRNPLKLAWMGMQWMLRDYGPLTVGAGQVGGAACTEHAAGARPDVQFNVMPLSVDKPGEPLHDYSGFTAAVWQCHPASRGRIRICSADPMAAPRIEANYLAEDIDRRTLVAGIRMLREIYRRPAFRELWEAEVVPGPQVDTDKGLLDFARFAGGTVFHCVGSCRMGSDAVSVVTPDLRVRGVERLRVIDASVMPIVTSANTHAAALMIGEKGADLVLRG